MVKRFASPLAEYAKIRIPYAYIFPVMSEAVVSYIEASQAR